MQYWIDGYNLIFHRGSPYRAMPLEEARDRLLGAASSFAHPVRVFFDGERFPGGWVSVRAPGTHVTPVFVREGTADDAVVRDLRKVVAKEVTVVTDDRELRLRVKQVGAQSVGVDKFLKRLATAGSSKASRRPKDAPKAEPGGNRVGLSKREVDDWLDYLGLDEDWLPED